MGEINQPRPVLLVAAITSRYEAAIDWAISQFVDRWGDLAFESPLFDFTETSFYAQSMGADLKKKLVAVKGLVNPEQLAATKILTNHWEIEFEQSSEFPEERPVNIDPGYVTEAKLVLATTKDRDHRIYLQSGIYAEVTLHYQSGRWQKSRWTYPDYQRDDFQDFLTKCRDFLRKRLQKND